MSFEPSLTSARQARLRALTEQALDSGASPADLCPDDPDLRTELEARLSRIRSLGAELDAVFPTPASHSRLLAHSPTDHRYPELPGHRIEHTLGHGGMGIVYKATHLRLNRPVAVKMLLAGAYASRRDLECLLREAESVARLQHPHIVQVYEVGDVKGQPYFTMEYLEGGTLASRLAATPQPARRAAELVRVLADAVDAAHRAQVVHRDLKPGNILLSAEGQLKVADFSLAREISGPAITHHAARLGTPSYMAPEQAQGTPDATKPAVDIYALGAILYECLTGRPPFRADTSEETRRQVIHEEPASPRRLNAKVPRDLETICLKALHKDPLRRYASAAALRDDLARFLASEPILARPVGRITRAAKWARRRPAAATVLASSIILLIASLSGAAWWQRFDAAQRIDHAARQSRARQIIESALLEADARRTSEQWSDGLRILTDATERLAEAQDPAFDQRLSQKALWLRTGQALEAVRQSRFNEFGAADLDQMHRRYAEVFSSAGINPASAPAAAIATISQSEIKPQLIAALDDWAIVALDLNQPAQCDTLHEVARAAAPDPAWADPLRTRSVWHDAARLISLSEHVPEQAPTHLLGQLGLLLARQADPNVAARGTTEALRRRCGFAATELLADAHHRHPTDFWVIWELAQQCRRNKQHARAVSLCRIAVALRPSSALALNGLGVALTENGDVDEAVEVYRRSIQLDPKLSLPRNNIIFALAHWGRWAAAQQSYEDAIAADPTLVEGAPVNYVGILLAHDRDAQAIPVISRLINLRPDDIRFRGSLGDALSSINRYDHAEAEFRACLRIDPNHAVARGWLARVYRDTARYEDAITELRLAAELEPERFLFHQGLGQLLAFLGRLQDAIAPLLTATNLLPEAPSTWVSLASTHLGCGRWDDARTAAQKVLTLGSRPEERWTAERVKSLADSLSSFSPDQLASAPPPNAIPALIEWHARYTRRPNLAIQLAQTSSPLPDSTGTYEHLAAAAALLSQGIGADNPPRTEADRQLHRQHALQWFKQQAAWLEAQSTSATSRDRTTAFDTARALLASRDFAPFREPHLTTRLPQPEQQEWAAAWERIRAVLKLDPAEQFYLARAHADQAHWPEAAAAYAVALNDPKLDDAEIWFEYAATQLLAGDRAGYQDTCDKMVARANSPRPLRPYLVLRTCTLGPARPTSLAAAAANAQYDLSRTDHWALTQLAALKCRTGQPADATAPIDRSNLANPKPGSAILNWLWEAIACRELNQPHDASRLTARADRWLSQLEALPRQHLEMGLHHHNWLEAHVLLNELKNPTRSTMAAPSNGAR